MTDTSSSSPSRLAFRDTLKEIKRNWIKGKPNAMPSPNEFKTSLRFDPSKLSTGILKRYLLDMLNGAQVETLLSCDPPTQYTKDPDNQTNYKILKELCMMALKDWKERLEKNNGRVECLYLENDMVATDARYFHECWKIIQDEVGNHETQMSFFRVIAEIVSDLGGRNYVDVDIDLHLDFKEDPLKDHAMKQVELEQLPAAPITPVVSADAATNTTAIHVSPVVGEWGLPTKDAEEEIIMDHLFD